MYSPADYYYQAQPSTLGTPHPSGDQSRARGGDDLRTSTKINEATDEPALDPAELQIAAEIAALLSAHAQAKA